MLMIATTGTPFQGGVGRNFHTPQKDFTRTRPNVVILLIFAVQQQQSTH